MRHFLITLLAFAAMTSTAQALVVTENGQPVGQALATRLVQAHVPLPPGVIDITYGQCLSHSQFDLEPDPDDGKIVGCTYGGTMRIWIATRGDYPTILHEIGHQFAYRVLYPQPALWNRILRLMGRSRGNPPDEQFAEAYSVCGRFTRWEDIRGDVTYGVSEWWEGRLGRVCAAIRAIRP